MPGYVPALNIAREMQLRQRRFTELLVKLNVNYCWISDWVSYMLELRLFLACFKRHLVGVDGGGRGW